MRWIVYMRDECMDEFTTTMEGLTYSEIREMVHEMYPECQFQGAVEEQKDRDDRYARIAWQLDNDYQGDD